MTALFRLVALGECEVLDIDGGDLGVDGAVVVEQEPTWRLEVVIRAADEGQANVLAEEIMSEAKWNYGDWNEWYVQPIGGAA